MLYNAENGTTSTEWKLSDNRGDTIEVFWQSHFAPYFKNVIKTKKENSIFWIYFSDGTYLRLTNNAVLNCIYYLSKNKQKWGRDVYYYLLMNDGKFITFYWPSDIDWINNNSIPKDEEKVTADITDRKNLLRLCKYVSNYCSTLLQYDGWEFKDDYPHKF